MGKGSELTGISPRILRRSKMARHEVDTKLKDKPGVVMTELWSDPIYPEERYSLELCEIRTVFDPVLRCKWYRIET